MHENRETSVVPDTKTGRSGKAQCQSPDMHAAEGSDSRVVPVNQPNNRGKPRAEAGKGRLEIKENTTQPNTRPTQSGVIVFQGLSGVRQRAVAGIRRNLCPGQASAGHDGACIFECPTKCGRRPTAELSSSPGQRRIYPDAPKGAFSGPCEQNGSRAHGTRRSQHRSVCRLRCGIGPKHGDCRPWSSSDRRSARLPQAEPENPRRCTPILQA